LCWDIRSAVDPVQSWDLSPSAVHSVAVDPAGSLLACAGGDGLITILDTTHQQEWTLRGHEECVWSVVFTPSAESLLSSAADGSVIVWS
jgi:ParB family chromosome partitioning protein